MKFVSASKKGQNMKLSFKAWLDKNMASISQVDFALLFNDGISANRYENELFVSMSRYVKARELLNK